jgi:hypothetical protein
MAERYLTILAREFRAGEGSFLLQLRIEMYWDKDAFRRLTEAMRACCKDYQYSQEQLERDLKEQEQLTEEQLEDEQFADCKSRMSSRHRTGLKCGIDNPSQT